jgi:hypothetical protein
MVMDYISSNRPYTASSLTVFFMGILFALLLFGRLQAERRVTHGSIVEKILSCRGIGEDVIWGGGGGIF